MAFLIRMAADSVSGLAWMRWASPLGWFEELRPLTGLQPLAFVPVILLIAAATGAAIALAGRRDLGAAVLARRPPGPSPGPGCSAVPPRWSSGSNGGSPWPGSAGSRCWPWSSAWSPGPPRRATSGSRCPSRSSAASAATRPGAAAWMGYEFLWIAALVAFAAAAQISGVRGEEADGHLDNLLARPVSRGTWLAGRLGFGVVLVLAAGLASGAGGWIGVAARHSAIGFGAMMQAGLNVTVPGLFILGLGTLLYGLAPRLAVPILYTVVLWSFLVEIIGSSITSSHWLLDTALLSHLGPVPATGVNWTAVTWLTGLGVICALAGLAAFRRRDLAAA